MAHGENEQFGEKRPRKQDEWGNDYRTIVTIPLKFEMKCDPKECRDHVTMAWKYEADTPAVDGQEMLLLMLQGQEIPMKKAWATLTKVLSAYN